MKVGDLVKFHTVPLLKRRLGCLPHIEDAKWAFCGLVQELYSDGHAKVLWPDRGLELVDDRFLEVVSESR